MYGDMYIEWDIKNLCMCIVTMKEIIYFEMDILSGAVGQYLYVCFSLEAYQVCDYCNFLKNRFGNYISEKKYLIFYVQLKH